MDGDLEGRGRVDRCDDVPDEPTRVPTPQLHIPRRALLQGATAVATGVTSLTLPAAATAASAVTPSLAGDDQLRLYLDAGLTSSYAGTGTTWNDLSGSANHATLVGTPTFVSAGTASHLRFDGNGGTTTTGQHAAAPPLGDLTAWTIEIWARLLDDHTSRITALVTDVLTSTAINLCIGTSRVPTDHRLAGSLYQSGWHYTGGVDGAGLVGKWHHHAATYDRTDLQQYLDGTAIGTATTADVTATSGGSGIRIARRWDDALNPGKSNYAAADVGLVRISARALTAAEVAANHSATRSRYGV